MVRRPYVSRPGASQFAEPDAALEHYTAVRDALENTQRLGEPVAQVLMSICLDRPVSGAAADGPAGRGGRRRPPFDGRGPPDGFPGLQALALTCLGTAAWQAGDREDALRLVRQAQGVPGDSAGGLHRALTQFVTMILTEAGDLAGAEQACAAGLASCREVGDLANLSGQLWNKVILDLRASRIDDATAHLRELLQVAMRTGLRPGVLIGLDCCGHLCAATRRPAEAITVWAAASALSGP
jgi:hypothetical protein